MPPITHRIATLTLLLGLVHFAPAQAQVEQTSLKLNVPPAGQYYSVANKTGLQGNASYTIEAWVRPTSYAGNPTIVGNNYATSFWLGLSALGRVRFYPRGGALNFVESTVPVPLNQWTHVAVTYDVALGWQIYLNGVLDGGSNSISGAAGTDIGDMRIGADREAGAPAYFWQGWLDEVRIWNERRTGVEIRETMFQGAGRPNNQTGAYANLRANWDSEQIAMSSLPDLASGLGEVSNFGLSVNGASGDESQAPPVAYNVGQEFNGIDNYAILAMDDGFAAGVTVEAWIAPVSTTGFPTIVGRGFASSFWFGLNGDGRLRFYPTGGTSVDGEEVIQPGRWTHVAATYRDGLTRLYINGKVDKVSTAVSGPVGENGRRPWIGADSSGAGTPWFLFRGILDEVRITRGALSVQTVREQMFFGYPLFVNPMNVFEDEDGIPRETARASFGQWDITPTIVGSPARVVRSGSLAAGLPGSDLTTFVPLHNYVHYVYGGSFTTLPEDYTAPSLSGFEVHPPLAAPVSDVDVFVVAGTTNLSTARLFLRHEGIEVDLVSPGQGTGRDVHAVFDDDSPHTLATVTAPYARHRIQPSQPLSAFNGLTADGFWSLHIVGDGVSRVDIWGWGLSINDLTVAGVGDDGSGVEFRLTGANPVRGSSSLSFRLPHAAEVDLALVDVQGREARRLFAGRRDAGTHYVQWSAERLGSGIYFARLRVDGRDVAPIRVTVLQ